MNIRKKSFIFFYVFILLFLLYSGMVFAEEESVVPRLTLFDCVSEALQNHSEILFAEYDLQDAIWELERLKMEDPRQVALKDLKEKEETVRRAREALREVKMNLALEIEESYYQILKTVQTVESKKRSLEWSKKQLEIVKIKYDGGLVSEKDLLMIKEKVETEEKGLTYAYFNLETAKMGFSLKMGWELDRVFELTDQKFPYDPMEVDLTESIQYANQHTQNLKNAKRAVEDAEEFLELKEKTYVPKKECEKAKHALEKAHYLLEEAKKEMIIRVRNAYVSINSSCDNVNNALEAYQKTEKELEILKIKYDAGMIALLEMVNGHSNLIDAESGWIQAIYDYNLAKASFNQTVGKGYSLYIEMSGSDNDE